MKNVILLTILFLICGGESFSQDTTLFKKLPDTLQQIIQRDVSLLTEQDTISGEVAYTQGMYIIGIRYKFFLNNLELVGSYSEITSCAGCYSQWLPGNAKAVVIYCCKDPLHNPQEAAKTKAEMVEIKKQKHCSKIGMCIID